MQRVGNTFHYSIKKELTDFVKSVSSFLSFFVQVSPGQPASSGLCMQPQRTTTAERMEAAVKAMRQQAEAKEQRAHIFRYRYNRATR
jgi:hypothetical protein